MTCPSCGAVIKASMTKCARCGLPLTYRDKMETGEKMPIKKLISRAALIVLAALVTLCIFMGVLVPLHYMRQKRLITERYVNQTVESVTMENNIQGHALTFFGTDGDSIYIDKLDESFMFVGGIARVEVPDSFWFGSEDTEPTKVESVTVKFSPIYVSATGKKTRIPSFSIEVPTPEAPITINNPTTDRLTVITSQTGLSMNVVYGSQVIINGEDVSDKVDRSGNLELTLNIQPIGDNNVSIIVRTDNHKEARRDLVFYREEMDIELEISSAVTYVSRLSYMTVSGKTEPGAWISVDTDYDRDSLKIDQSTGNFSFKAKFSSYGENLVSFHASMDGRNDSAISFYVDYLPAKAEYTRNAWTMDYAQLKLYYEQWKGKVFLCIGKIVDVYTEDGITYYVMNVGNTEDVKLVALENQSNVGQFLRGSEYAVYADVIGRVFYDSNYIPCLIARYDRD